MYHNRTAFSVIGAALFLGLAANLHALPIKASEHLTTGNSAWALQVAQNPVQAPGLDTWNRSLTKHTLLPSSRNGWLEQVRAQRNGRPYAAAKGTVINSNGTITSVPDGGLTAIMLGGALCGLILLRNKPVTLRR